MLVAVSVTAANRWCVRRVKRLFTGQGVGISQEIVQDLGAGYVELQRSWQEETVTGWS